MFSMPFITHCHTELRFESSNFSCLCCTMIVPVTKANRVKTFMRCNVCKELVRTEFHKSTPVTGQFQIWLLSRKMVKTTMENLQLDYFLELSWILSRLDWIIFSNSLMWSFLNFWWHMELSVWLDSHCWFGYRYWHNEVYVVYCVPYEITAL